MRSEDLLRSLFFFLTLPKVETKLWAICFQFHKNLGIPSPFPPTPSPNDHKWIKWSRDKSYFLNKNTIQEPALETP